MLYSCLFVFLLIFFDIWLYYILKFGLEFVFVFRFYNDIESKFELVYLCRNSGFEGS